MTVKKPFSFFDLSRANPTATLLEKLFRDSITYKKEIDDLFEAVVLTQPTLSSENLQAVITNSLADDESANRTTYCFIVRIEGPNSPHLFLPDPSEFYLTPDEECQKRYHNLLQLHTLVVANNTAKEALPSIGDKVQIRLTKNDYLYDSKISTDYKGIVIKSAAGGKALRDRRTRLQENAKNAFDSGASGTSPITTGPATLGAATSTGTSSDKQKLHNGYMTLYRNKSSISRPRPQEIYNMLYDDLSGRGFKKINNLVIGIMTNAWYESSFNPDVISGDKEESSIGLFQMNVGNEGRFGTSRGIGDRQNKIVSELRIPTSAGNVIPYYAGGRFLDSMGKKAITPAQYVKNGENPDSLKDIYDALSNWREQLNYVSFVVEGMINTLSIDIQNLNKYTADQWTTWFQAYFEQPENIKSRVWDASVLSLRSE